MAESDGIVREFLKESLESLQQADTDLVTLESQGADKELLDRVFRAIHTVKGTCGFLGFSKLEELTHAGEELLARLRDGDVELSPAVVELLLRLVDGVRAILNSVAETGGEGAHEFSDPVGDLGRVKKGGARKKPAPKSATGKRRRSKKELSISLSEASGPTSSGAGAGGDPSGSEEPSDPAARESSTAPSVRAVGRAAVENSVRVDVALLDQLMDLVGELVLTRNELIRMAHTDKELDPRTTFQNLDLITSELQARVMKTRMQPVGSIWGKFPRLVRDLAFSFGKKVRLEMEGQDTELDRSLIEAIKDPLTHLVRNALDHGFEPPEERERLGKPAMAHLRLAAYPEAGQVNIEISDDGRGIDPELVRSKAIERKLISPENAAALTPDEALNLIFLPGFSTAEEVTNMSGRGVGMDVVRNNIERINGLVAVESRPGLGTTVRLKIPLTLAIIPALTVTTNDQRFAIPQSSVLELVHLEGGREGGGLEMVHGAPVYRLRGQLLPIVDLRQELDLEALPELEEELTIVVLQADERQFGLLVDSVADTQEILVKPLGGLLERIPVFVGATILGDASVALILDVLGLAQRAHVISEVRDQQRTRAGDREEAGAAVERVLLCRSADDGRMAIPLLHVERLETFPESRLETVGGQLVVQYRGRILPLIDVYSYLPERRSRPRSSGPELQSDDVRVVVYGCGNGYVGLIVGGVVDIREEVVEELPASREGVLKCAVLGGKITEFLDMDAIISKAAPPFLEEQGRPEDGD